MAVQRVQVLQLQRLGSLELECGGYNRHSRGKLAPVYKLSLRDTSFITNTSGTMLPLAHMRWADELDSSYTGVDVPTWAEKAQFENDLGVTEQLSQMRVRQYVGSWENEKEHLSRLPYVLEAINAIRDDQEGIDRSHTQSPPPVLPEMDTSTTTAPVYEPLSPVISTQEALENADALSLPLSEEAELSSQERKFEANNVLLGETQPLEFSQTEYKDNKNNSEENDAISVGSMSPLVWKDVDTDEEEFETRGNKFLDYLGVY